MVNCFSRDPAELWGRSVFDLVEQFGLSVEEIDVLPVADFYRYVERLEQMEDWRLTVPLFALTPEVPPSQEVEHEQALRQLDHDPRAGEGEI